MSVTKLLQCLRDELVRRDYAASTIRSYIQIPDAFRQETAAVSIGPPGPTPPKRIRSQDHGGYPHRSTRAALRAASTLRLCEPEACQKSVSIQILFCRVHPAMAR